MSGGKHGRIQSKPARVLLALVLLLVAGACALGFLATFEPDDPVKTWAFRALYSVIVLASALAGCRLLFSRRLKS